MKSYSLAAVALIGTVALVGCSQSSGPEKADVAGVVQLDGKPLTDASIRFHSDNIGSAAFPLDESGEFKSRFPIRVGEYQVAVDYGVERMPGGPLSGDLAKVPEHFWSLSDSGLTATVSGAGENVYTFDIDSSAKAPPGFRPKKNQSTPPPPAPPGIENK